MRRGSLFKKYALTFGTLVVGSLLVSGLIEIYFSYTENKSALIELQLEKANASASQIGQYISDIEQRIAFTSQPKPGIGALENRRIEIESLSQVSAITQIALLDSAGTEQLRISSLGPVVSKDYKDYSQSEAFRSVKSGKPYRSPVYFLRDVEPYMTIAMAVGPKEAGITIAEVNLEFLLDGISRIKVGKAGYAYIVDNQGRLIAHPDISLVLNKSNLSSLPQIKAAINHVAGKDNDSGRGLDLSGNSVLTANGTIPYLGWFVFVEQPLSEAYAPIYESIVRAGLILVAGVVLSLLASILFARRMVAPIHLLQKGAMLIGAGSLNHRIGIHTGDELETLADQFNRMAEKLADHIQTLEDRVAARTGELEVIFQNASIGIEYVSNRRVVRVNKTFAAMFGYNSPELIGQSTRFLYASDEEYEVADREAYSALAAGAASYKIDLATQRKDGSELVCELVGSLVDPTAPENGTIWLVSDVTELRSAQKKLQDAKKSAELAAEAIREKSEQVANLLDNSGQGFMSFGADLVIEPAFSRACEAILGESPAGKNGAEVFFHDDAVKADLFRTIISSVLSESDSCTREIMLSLLPTEIQRNDVLLKVEFKILDNGKFMVVLTDITAERRMAAMLDSERLRLELIVMAVSDSRNFFDTIDGFNEFLTQDLPRLLKGAAAPQIIAGELYRGIHTYKGLLNQFSFPYTPGALHDIESGLSGALSLGDRLTAQKIADLVSSETLQTTFHKDLGILSDALGDEFLAHGESFILSEGQALQLEKLATRLLRGETIDTSVAEIRRLLKEVGTLRKVAFRDVLMGFDGLVSQAAARLEKEVAPIVVRGGADIWIDPKTYRPFLRSLVHVFRNSVAHGIETPEARWEAEKDEAGKITCSVTVEGKTIKLSIADDGGGVDLDAVRQRLVEARIYSASDVLTVPDDEIARLIFMDSISTQREVTTLAGRGVGLAAVLSETTSMGGEVVVKTVAGQGTEFLFTLPLQQGDLSEVV